MKISFSLFLTDCTSVFYNIFMYFGLQGEKNGLENSRSTFFFMFLIFVFQVACQKQAFA